MGELGGVSPINVTTTQELEGRKGENMDQKQNSRTSMGRRYFLQVTGAGAVVATALRLTPRTPGAMSARALSSRGRCGATVRGRC